MKKIVYTGLVLGALLGIGFLGKRAYNEVEAIKNLDYSITNVRVMDMQGEKVRLEVSVKFVNTAEIQLRVNAINIAVSYKGQRVNDVVKSDPIILPPVGAITHKIDVFVNLVAMGVAFTRVITGTGNNEVITLSGSVNYNIHTLPVAYNLTIEPIEVNVKETFRAVILEKFGIAV